MINKKIQNSILRRVCFNLLLIGHLLLVKFPFCNDMPHSFFGDFVQLYSYKTASYLCPARLEKFHLVIESESCESWHLQEHNFAGFR